MKFAFFALALALPLPGFAQSQQRTTTLAALRDRNRVLLVFEGGDAQMGQRQRETVMQHAAEFRERDLVLVGLHGNQDTVPAAKLSACDDAAARARFQIEPGTFVVMLLGKDGGEKLRSHAPIAWETLQQTIDAMPMRRSEARGGASR